MRGGFQLTAHASGRQWPSRGDDWSRFLDKATLTFAPDPRDIKSSGSTVGLNGSLMYQNGKVLAPHISFESPWLEGNGRVEIQEEKTTGQTNLRGEAALEA